MILFYIILSTVLISLISFVGILIFSKKKYSHSSFLKIMISLAAGALLAVTFTDLLPEAVEGSGDVHKVFLVVLVSFLTFFILERFIHWHHCHCDSHDHIAIKNKKNIIFTNLIGDGFHNMMDGFLIATAFMLDPFFGIMTTIAVALHEIPQEIADFGVLLYGGLSRKKALFFNFLSALTAVAGGVAFYYFGKSFEHLIPYFAAFAAGNFLYLAAADLIPELYHDRDKKSISKHTIWLLLGVGIILIINSILPHSHAEHEEHVFLFGIPAAQAQTVATSTSIELLATSTIPVDGLDIYYNNITEFDTDIDGAVDRLSYYLNGLLVLTTYDTNFDSVADLWLIYDKNLNIIKEVMDTNGDEQFDLIVNIDESGQVIDVEGWGEKVEDVIDNNTNQVSDTESVVNDSAIDIGLATNLFSSGRIIIAMSIVIIFGLIFIIKKRR